MAVEIPKASRFSRSPTTKNNNLCQKQKMRLLLELEEKRF